MVPLGPRLDLRTSCKPLAALMFIWSAADLFSTSAFGFSTLIDIFPPLSLSVSHRQTKCESQRSTLNERRFIRAFHTLHYTQRDRDPSRPRISGLWTSSLSPCPAQFYIEKTHPIFFLFLFLYCIIILSCPK